MSSEDFSLRRVSLKSVSSPRSLFICSSRGRRRLGRVLLFFPAIFKHKPGLRAGVRLPGRRQCAASAWNMMTLACCHAVTAVCVAHQFPAQRRGSVNWLTPGYLWTSARGAWWTVSSVGGCAFVKFTPSPSSPPISPPLWFIQRAPRCPSPYSCNTCGRKGITSVPRWGGGASELTWRTNHEPVTMETTHNVTLQIDTISICRY